MADLCAIYIAAIESDSFRGSVNGVSPNIISQKLFSETLSKVFHRPAIPMPKMAVEVLFGESALLLTEGVKLVWTPEAVAEIARIAAEVNGRSQNIGARRLHTVLERLLDEVSFGATELNNKDVQIDPAYVRERLGELVKDEDLSKYIL